MSIPQTAQRGMSSSERAERQLALLKQLMVGAPFQPATNLWRAIEIPVLADALPVRGHGLDVGCGDGVLTGILRNLVQADWTLTGIDPDPEETALAEASDEYERVHTAGADHVPEADATFDFAFANSVLEHVDNLPDCLADVSRCLKPGGVLRATVPSPSLHRCLKGPGWTRMISREAYFKETDVRLRHKQYWSEERWSEQLDEAGFDLEAIQPYLTRKQVRRWEFLTNWTGGLLYRLQRGKKYPVEIQRSLGMRRRLPNLLRPCAGPIAWTVSRGIMGDEESDALENGCFLVNARKRSK